MAYVCVGIHLNTKAQALHFKNIALNVTMCCCNCENIFAGLFSVWWDTGRPALKLRAACVDTAVLCHMLEPINIMLISKPSEANRRKLNELCLANSNVQTDEHIRDTAHCLHSALLTEIRHTIFQTYISVVFLSHSSSVYYHPSHILQP